MPSPFSKVFRWLGAKQQCLNAKAANGVGSNVDVSQFKNVGVAIITSNFTGTLQCAGSFAEWNDANLIFSNTASVLNPWGFVGMYEYDQITAKKGTDGIAYAGDTSVKLYTVNTNEIHTLNYIVSNYVSGNVTVLVYPSNNQ